jgi:chloramphenicol 3-O phosphotransferase
VIWLVGGPSVGKSSIALAIQEEGGLRDSWVLAGDQHFLRVLRRDVLIRFVATPDDDGWPGWTVPVDAGSIVGRPHAGGTALRLLDGMYRAVRAMAEAGNHVVLEDVAWEASIARLGLAALEGGSLFVVRVTCPLAMALQRERERPDRVNGAVAAFGDGPEWITDVDMEVDTSDSDPRSCARRILSRWHETR